MISTHLGAEIVISRAPKRDLEYSYPCRMQGENQLKKGLMEESHNIYQRRSTSGTALAILFACSRSESDLNRPHFRFNTTTQPESSTEGTSPHLRTDNGFSVAVRPTLLLGHNRQYTHRKSLRQLPSRILYCHSVARNMITGRAFPTAPAR